MPRRDYRAKLRADNAAVLERSRVGRDIAGEYPPPGDLVVRAACERDFRLFCETYFPNAFNLAWSEDHLKVIARMEDVILHGGHFALAMPRGAGKTTLSVRAALWALLYGHRRFVCLIGATEKRAEGLMKQFKSELMFNERLGDDFRQVCYPIVRLENNGRKAIGQLFQGERTGIEWGADRLTFPTMPDEACDGANVSGFTVSVAGLTGALRGQSHTLPTGQIIRPEIALLDDPQTRESAMSLSQSETRAAIINGDVLGMAGPGQDIAAIMPCTVIRSGDMADGFLDREKNPEWNGRLTKMVYAFPRNEKLWEDYKQIREESLKAERGGVEATEFYRDHREDMDAGAVVAWAERFNRNELSAVQHAMNLRFRNERAFFAEYQNSPLPDDDATGEELTPDEIASKLNRMPRGAVPITCNRVTAMIDVQASLLYYAVCAWEDDFTGYVIDYGTWPDQRRDYFTLRDAKLTLPSPKNSPGVEGQIFAGLEALTAHLIGRHWPRDDGASASIARCLIDAGAWTDTILQFCRQSAHAGIVTPSHGKFVGPASMPFREWHKKPGDRVGHHWRVPGANGKGSVRHVLMDINYWKSFLHGRFAVAMGNRGCLSLFGDKPARHRMIADHLTAENCRPQIDEKSGRKVDVWRVRPERPDNHLLDCLVGCAVAASMEGVTLAEASAAAPARSGKVSFRDLQKQRQTRQQNPRPR